MDIDEEWLMRLDQLHLERKSEDPIVRWRAISSWYELTCSRPNSRYQFALPMTELTAWVAEQPFATPLFPTTSHKALGVKLHTEYNRDLPCFWCEMQPDGQFEYSLYKSMSEFPPVEPIKRVVPFSEAREVFVEFVGLLQELWSPVDVEPEADHKQSHSL